MKIERPQSAHVNALFPIQTGYEGEEDTSRKRQCSENQKEMGKPVRCDLW